MEIVKKEKQLREVIIDSYELCDKCNKKIDIELYDAFEFVIEYKEGNKYPEGGYGTKKTVDLCQKCANDLMELLKTNGYRINHSEWDY